MYCILSRISFVSSTPVRDAASISIKSIKLLLLIARQFSHLLHGSAVTPVLQFRHFASNLPSVVLPTPRVPVNK